MEGSPQGGYVVEYIPQAEDIQSWREGYLVVQRMPYPSASSMADLKKANAKIADVALYQFMKKVEQTCGGRHQAMTQAANNYNGAPTSRLAAATATNMGKRRRSAKDRSSRLLKARNSGSASSLAGVPSRKASSKRTCLGG
jgi:hypothetical protein